MPQTPGKPPDCCLQNPKQKAMLKALLESARLDEDDVGVEHNHFSVWLASVDGWDTEVEGNCECDAKCEALLAKEAKDDEGEED